MSISQHLKSRNLSIYCYYHIRESDHTRKIELRNVFVLDGNFSRKLDTLNFPFQDEGRR